ncbi:hypothetical protein B7494_g8407 [Chlorociboria aeruginascens]|nr:hypothetical protein B7494_g8407 [Chlorociboria aeruginascens]
MLTTAERPSNEPEFVLVTPIYYDLCPDCKAGGYDQRPDGANPPPRTASVMPTDYENLPRMISVLPSDDFLPDSDDSEGTMNYLSSSSQFPSRAPAYQSLAPSTSRVPSYRPSTSVPNTFGTSETEKVKASLTAAELLKRGPPKNVTKSAFYDNADGEEARGQLEKGSTISSSSIRPSTSAPRYSTSIHSSRSNASSSTSIPSGHSGFQKVRSSTSIPSGQSSFSPPRSSTYIPRNISRTQAPSIDEENLDISDLLREIEISSEAPSSAANSRQPTRSAIPSTAPARSSSSSTPTKSVVPSRSRLSASSLPTVSQIPNPPNSRKGSKPSVKNGRGKAEPQISAISEEE